MSAWVVVVDGALVEVNVEADELEAWRARMRVMGLRVWPLVDGPGEPSAADLADVVHAVRRAEQVGVLTRRQRDLLFEAVAAHERRLFIRAG